VQLDQQLQEPFNLLGEITLDISSLLKTLEQLSTLTSLQQHQATSPPTIKGLKSTIQPHQFTPRLHNARLTRSILPTFTWSQR
jgi:hypothetical protein